MKTKTVGHTPGPWSVHGDCKTMIGCDDRKMMLAEALYKHPCIEWSRKLPEAQANARLIAAAPKMLETLYRVQAFLACSGKGAANSHCADIVDEAIAAAEGQQ